jgi:cation-transporting ATPase E
VVAVVLCFIQAVVAVLTGVMLILDRFLDEFSHGGVTIVTLAGAASVLIGLFLFTVASGMLRGDRVARIGLTVLLVLDLASDAYLGMADPSGILVRAGSAALSIVILVVVWTGRPRRYFAYRG